MKKLLCATLDGNEAKAVDVEAVFVRALPSFSIVGLPSKAIQESKDRVKAALVGTGFKFPVQKITLNLSPSDLKKEGSHFDLAIALSIALQKSKANFDEFYIFGELGLDGKIKSTAILFSILLSIAQKPTKVIVPKDIAKEAATIPNLEVYALESLTDALDFFLNENSREEYLCEAKSDFFDKGIEILGKSYVVNENFELDFKDVKGQIRAKRAALISAAGMHNLILEGSPGCGKSMIIKRLRYILPPLSENEILQNAAYQSLNQEESKFSQIRPFRSPHHTSTRASIYGGGSQNARLGEVALANNGMLFFDEFPHFSKQILESLREPLEDKEILISRVNSKITYKTKFLFVAALNPCPCGNLFSFIKPCKCTELEVKRYKSKISEPLMDRLDLYVQMEENDPKDKADINSKQMQEQVLVAFKNQKLREQKDLNANLSDEEIEKFCQLNQECQALINSAISKFGLSQRSVNKVKKVARTIADLKSKENINKEHILEALSYRNR